MSEQTGKYKPTTIYGDRRCVDAAHICSEKSQMKIVAPVYRAFTVDQALSYVNQLNSRQQPFRAGEERGLGG